MPYAALNGQSTWYTDSGGPGVAVLALHGFPLDTRQFDPLLDALADDAPMRLVRYDQRGAGQTPWDGAPFDVEALAADAAALLDHLAIERPVLLGAGLGVTVALQLALDRPLRGLVLVGGRADAADALSIAGYRTMMAAWGPHGPPPPMLDGIADAWIGSRARRPELWATWRSRLRALDPATLAARSEALNARPDLTRRLATVDCPAVILHSAFDEVVPPEMGIDLATALPHASDPIYVDDEAHVLTLTRPDAVLGALAGLIERTGGPP